MTTRTEKEELVAMLSVGLIEDIIDSIWCKGFAYNKSVSKGYGENYIDVDQFTRDSVCRLKEKLIEIATDDI